MQCILTVFRLQLGQVPATLHHAFELSADTAIAFEERLFAQAIFTAVLKVRANGPCAVNPWRI